MARKGRPRKACKCAYSPKTGRCHITTKVKRKAKARPKTCPEARVFCKGLRGTERKACAKDVCAQY